MVFCVLEHIQIWKVALEHLENIWKLAYAVDGAPLQIPTLKFLTHPAPQVPPLGHNPWATEGGGGAKKSLPLHTPFMWVTHTPNLIEFRPIMNGLGGDSITDRQTNAGDYNIPFAFLKKHGCKNAYISCMSLLLFRYCAGLIWNSGSPLICRVRPEFFY